MRETMLGPQDGVWSYGMCQYIGWWSGLARQQLLLRWCSHSAFNSAGKGRKHKTNVCEVFSHYMTSRPFSCSLLWPKNKSQTLQISAFLLLLLFTVHVLEVKLFYWNSFLFGWGNAWVGECVIVGQSRLTVRVWVCCRVGRCAKDICCSFYERHISGLKDKRQETMCHEHLLPHPALFSRHCAGETSGWVLLTPRKKEGVIQYVHVVLNIWFKTFNQK